MAGVKVGFDGRNGFAGLLATVETVLPRRRRIKLLIDFLARQTSVDLPLTAIRGLRLASTGFAKPPLRPVLHGATAG